MIVHSLRKALLDRQVLFGTWLQIGHPAVAEILASDGYDFLAIDLVHADIELASFANLARAMQGKRPLPLVRSDDKDSNHLIHLLDLGAQGLIVPGITSAEIAKSLIEAIKYPPNGKRSYGLSRANDYGIHFETNVKKTNEDVALIAVIDSKEGLEAIDKIAAVDGIDGFFFDAHAISISLGAPGKITDPVVKDARNKVLRTSRTYQKPAGILLTHPSSESITQTISDGFTLIGLGLDSTLLHSASRKTLELARQAHRLITARNHTF